jgi:Cytochrome c biogenesis protein
VDVHVNVWIAFWAGLVSFVSPCCLPLYPSYLSYITGLSVKTIQEQKDGGTRRTVMTHSIFFILGFSVIYFVLGATANALAELFVTQRELISRIGGVLIIAMGLIMLGVFQPQLLMREWKPSIMRRAGYFGTFLIGIGFAAGWSPCVGPILTAIIALAAQEPGSWIPLMTAYSLGFAVPFLVLSFFIGKTRWIARYSGAVMKVGGAVMIAIGVLLFTGKLNKLSVWLQSITPDWMII